MFDVLMPQMGESVAEGHDRPVDQAGRRARREGRAAVRDLDRQGGCGDSVARGRGPARDSRARRPHGRRQQCRGRDWEGRRSRRGTSGRGILGSDRGGSGGPNDVARWASDEPRRAPPNAVVAACTENRGRPRNRHLRAGRLGPFWPGHEVTTFSISWKGRRRLPSRDARRRARPQVHQR